MWRPVALLALVSLAAGQSPTPNPSEPPKSARVSGVVIDQQDNRPLSHVTVCFSDNFNLNDGAEDHCDETDARGVFSVVDLPSGRIHYWATRPGFFSAEPLAVGSPSILNLNAGDELRDIKLRLRRAGVIAGRVTYVDGEPFSGAFLTANGGPSGNHQTASNDLGEYRFADLLPGDYSVEVRPQGQPRDQVVNCERFNAGKTRIYVDQSADRLAPAVHVGAGETAVQPDFVMVQVTPRRVTGRIVWDQYPLPGPWLVHGADETVQSRASDGTFSLCGVPPGEHALEISAIFEGRRIAGDVKISVADADLKEVEIVAEPSALIRAWIEVEDNVPLDLSRAWISSISILPNPHDSTPQVRHQPDGTYIIDELYTSEYRFALSGLPQGANPLPPGAYLKSIELEGRELIDAPLMVHAGDTIDGLVFTVSAKAGSLNGVVRDDMSLPVSDAFVKLQPDPRHADPDVHICERTVDQNGAFTCQNLAPGKYRIAAWRKTPDQPDSQAVQETVSSSGTPVEIPESGEVAVNVPLLKQ
jgi:hypothetical protein